MDVDVLGGMFGVAYRASHFDLDRLLDYSGHDQDALPDDARNVNGR